MEVRIQNNDDGTVAGVTRGSQLRVVSESHSLPFHVSYYQGGVYQFVAEATLINGTAPVWHLKNTDNSKMLVLAEMDVQVVDPAGGTAIPSVNTYVDIGYGATYTSGGSALTPVNQNRTTGKVAAVDLYEGAPTLGGTFVETQKWYVSGEADRYTFEERDGAVLGLNDTMTMRVVSDHTSGTALSHCTFMMLDPEEL